MRSALQQASREAQRKDACEHLRALDTRKIRPAVPRRYWIAGAALLLLCAAAALIPGSGDRIVGTRRELAEKIAPMAAKIEEAAVKEEDGRSDEEKAELRKLTEELKRELSDSRDEVDALVALDRAEKRLEQLRRQTAGGAESAVRSSSSTFARIASFVAARCGAQRRAYQRERDSQSGAVERSRRAVQS